MMLRLRGRLKSERGQVLILFVGIFTIIMLVGAITVDFGLWFSERRGAQTDADLSALAGAQEYEKYLALGCSYPGGQSAADAAAVAAANSWFNDNNESGNASLPIPIAPTSPPCGTFGVSPCVKVTVKHDTQALFTSIFGLGPSDIGADAKACAGTETGTTEVIPIQLNNSVNDPCFTINGTPNYPSLCLLEGGSQSTQGFTDAVRGVLDLDYSGAHCSPGSNVQQIADMILNGAPGNCNVKGLGTCGPGPWDDCALVQTGNAQAYPQAFEARIARQGACDTITPLDGIEEFSETVNMHTPFIDPATGLVDPAKSLYDRRVCPPGGGFWDSGKISPRIIKALVLGAVSSGNGVYPIVALDSFYIAGCYDDRNPDPTNISQLDPNCTGNVPPGHISVWGQFVRLTDSGGDFGPPDPSSTLFGVHLTE